LSNVPGRARRPDARAAALTRLAPGGLAAGGRGELERALLQANVAGLLLRRSGRRAGLRENAGAFSSLAVPPWFAALNG
jgi:hypothetical protein